MIIPIGHDHPLSRTPWATYTIIALCALVQIYASTGIESAEAVFGYGYATDGSSGVVTLLTSAFIHAGWMHLIGNMLFLFLAGTAIEDRWGPVGYVAFYLAGAAAAALAFRAANHETPTLLVGASGAVAALMGAFLVCFSKAKIRLWYWFFRSPGTFQLAAYVALPLWLVEQVALSMRDGDTSGVAYAAHFGGFGFGAVVALVVQRLLPPEAAAADGDDDEAPAPRRADAPRAPKPVTAPAAAPPTVPNAARVSAPVLVAPAVELRPSATPIVRVPGADEPKLLG
jgi:membrane associated rhomboid family serine protease